MENNLEQKFGSPKEELEWLKRRYEEKKTELEKMNEPESERKAANSAIKEHVWSKPEKVLRPYYQISEKTEENLVSRILKLPPEAHDKKIEELLSLAEEKGIITAVLVARKLNNPHLEDDLHRALVQYFIRPDLPKKKVKKNISGALQMVLYEISLPRGGNKEEKKEKTFKEIVSAMEQFYAGMGAVQQDWESPYFALELGIPAVGEEIAFYAAVPRAKAGLLEKHVMALFPDAKIFEKKDDYNIFKPEGASAGAIISLKTHEVLPIRTYDKFDVDPMLVIINVFSKLKKVGEGAALQLVVGKNDDGFNKKIKKTADEMRKGEKLRDAMKKAGVAGGFFDFLSDVFSGSSSKNKNKEKPEDERKIIADENIIKLLDEKSSKPVMLANVRLLVSADNAERAKMILREIESAFLQFVETAGNSVKFKEMSGRPLEKLFYDFSFRNFDEKESIRLNLAELSTIFHFPTGISTSAQLKYAEAKDAPPPLNLAEDGLFLGINYYRGDEKKIYMKDDDRRRHFYIIGQTGTGKSVLLKNMITQDILNGKGVCYIDPHGSDIQDILSKIPEERADDLIYFDPSDTERSMGLNMLEFDPNHLEQKTFIANEIYSIFRKIWKDVPEAFGPMFEQYYRNSVLLVMEDPSSGNTLFEVARVMSDKKFRDQKLAKCQNPMVRLFWRDVAEKAGGEAALANIVPYITSKFDVFLGNEIMRPILTQEKSAFNFRDIMDKKKILLINLSKGRLGDVNANLVGLIMVGKLLMAALSRVDMSEDQRNDFYLYIDEFQNITTDSIAVILSEARKYKLNLIVANQFIAQLEEPIKKAVFGNVGSMGAFRVGSEDAEFLAKQFEPVFNAGDLVNIGNYNAYLKMLMDGKAARPFNIKTVPFEKGDMETAKTLAKISSLKYGCLRAEVETEIRNKYNLG